MHVWKRMNTLISICKKRKKGRFPPTLSPMEKCLNKTLFVKFWACEQKATEKSRKIQIFLSKNSYKLPNLSECSKVIFTNLVKFGYNELQVTFGFCLLFVVNIIQS